MFGWRLGARGAADGSWRSRGLGSGGRRGALALCRGLLELSKLGTPQRALLSVGVSRKEQWSGLPFPSPGDLPDPGIEPISPASPAVPGGFFTTEPPGKPI